MKFYFDEHGLLVTRSGDGGDTAANTGRYYYGLALRRHFGLPVEQFPKNTVEDFAMALHHLEVSPGVYRRHPTQWSEPNDFSRDQQTPLVFALHAYGFMTRLTELRKAHEARLFNKYQNKDYASPEHMNYYRRAFGEEPTKLGDLFMVLGSKLFQYKPVDDLADDLNHTCAILFSMVNGDTATSKWAREVYKKRPENIGNRLPFGERNNIQAAWTAYHVEESPWIHEVYRPLIAQFLS